MIYLNEPNLKGRGLDYIKKCFESNWISTSGKFVEEFEKKMANYLNIKHAIAVNSGTSALFLALQLVETNPNDEVIVPTITFIAPINAISYHGAKPVFMDVDKYYNIDTKKTKEFILNETQLKNGFTYNKITGKKITAIIIVHVFGNAVNLEELQDICYKRNITIIEDAAESIGTFYATGTLTGKYTGSVGKINCTSFNGNKIITSASGGMIFLNDDELANKARYLKNQAKDDSTKYIHNNIGFNIGMTNIQAAIGLSQLETINDFLEIKRNNHKFYISKINDIKGLSISLTPDYAINNCWLNILEIDTKVYNLKIDEMIKKLAYNKIESRYIWYPNHMQKPYISCQNYKIDFAEKIINERLCLPSGTGLSYSNISKITSVLTI